MWEMDMTNGRQDGVYGLALNTANTILVTADSQGWITVMDIEQTCIDDSDIITPPKVISNFRAHIKCIVGVEFVNAEILVTASVDGTSRMFTVSFFIDLGWKKCNYLNGYLNQQIEGEYIGTFGQENIWDLSSPDTYAHPAKPMDVMITQTKEKALRKFRTATQKIIDHLRSNVDDEQEADDEDDNYNEDAYVDDEDEEEVDAEPINVEIVFRRHSKTPNMAVGSESLHMGLDLQQANPSKSRRGSSINTMLKLPEGGGGGNSCMSTSLIVPGAPNQNSSSNASLALSPVKPAPSMLFPKIIVDKKDQKGSLDTESNSLNNSDFSTSMTSLLADNSADEVSNMRRRTITNLLTQGYLTSNKGGRTSLKTSQTIYQREIRTPELLQKNYRTWYSSSHYGASVASSIPKSKGSLLKAKLYQPGRTYHSLTPRELDQVLDGGGITPPVFTTIPSKTTGTKPPLPAESNTLSKDNTNNSVVQAAKQSQYQIQLQLQLQLQQQLKSVGNPRVLIDRFLAEPNSAERKQALTEYIFNNER
jgi:hypothetical protein